METIYIGDFRSREDVESAFRIELSDSAHLLIACNRIDDGEGEAWVIYEDHGTLYDVWARHCDCDSLVGKWEPEETTISYIKGSIETLERNAEGWRRECATAYAAENEQDADALRRVLAWWEARA